MASKESQGKDRRSSLSILKTREALGDIDANVLPPKVDVQVEDDGKKRKSRRVSFAETYQVKEFLKDSQWATSQEVENNLPPNYDIPGLENLLNGPLASCHQENIVTEDKQQLTIPSSSDANSFLAKFLNQRCSDSVQPVSTESPDKTCIFNNEYMDFTFCDEPTLSKRQSSSSSFRQPLADRTCTFENEAAEMDLTLCDQTLNTGPNLADSKAFLAKFIGSTTTTNATEEIVSRLDHTTELSVITRQLTHQQAVIYPSDTRQFLESSANRRPENVDVFNFKPVIMKTDVEGDARKFLDRCGGESSEVQACSTGNQSIVRPYTFQNMDDVSMELTCVTQVIPEPEAISHEYANVASSAYNPSYLADGQIDRFVEKTSIPSCLKSEPINDSIDFGCVNPNDILDVQTPETAQGFDVSQMRRTDVVSHLRPTDAFLSNNECKMDVTSADPRESVKTIGGEKTEIFTDEETSQMELTCLDSGVLKNRSIAGEKTKIFADEGMDFTRTDSGVRNKSIAGEKTKIFADEGMDFTRIDSGVRNKSISGEKTEIFTDEGMDFTRTDSGVRKKSIPGEKTEIFTDEGMNFTCADSGVLRNKSVLGEKTEIFTDAGMDFTRTDSGVFRNKSIPGEKTNVFIDDDTCKMNLTCTGKTINLDSETSLSAGNLPSKDKRASLLNSLHEMTRSFSQKKSDVTSTFEAKSTVPEIFKERTLPTFSFKQRNDNNTSVQTNTTVESGIMIEKLRNEEDKAANKSTALKQSSIAVTKRKHVKEPNKVDQTNEGLKKLTLLDSPTHSPCSKKVKTLDDTRLTMTLGEIRIPLLARKSLLLNRTFSPDNNGCEGDTDNAATTAGPDSELVENSEKQSDTTTVYNTSRDNQDTTRCLKEAGIRYLDASVVTASDNNSPDSAHVKDADHLPEENSEKESNIQVENKLNRTFDVDAEEAFTRSRISSDENDGFENVVQCGEINSISSQAMDINKPEAVETSTSTLTDTKEPLEKESVQQDICKTSNTSATVTNSGPIHSDSRGILSEVMPRMCDDESMFERSAAVSVESVPVIERSEVLLIEQPEPDPYHGETTNNANRTSRDENEELLVSIEQSRSDKRLSVLDITADKIQSTSNTMKDVLTVKVSSEIMETDLDQPADVSNQIDDKATISRLLDNDIEYYKQLIIQIEGQKKENSRIEEMIDSAVVDSLSEIEIEKNMSEILLSTEEIKYEREEETGATEILDETELLEGIFDCELVSRDDQRKVYRFGFLDGSIELVVTFDEQLVTTDVDFFGCLSDDARPSAHFIHYLFAVAVDDIHHSKYPTKSHLKQVTDHF
ncbi:uncharacterized protein LOC141915217 [Tubulanus polymorphus]|uniref:uncharacterized protein LOC141915217 n=1 Tax=Tubulanus polymorphus TaxID=672921 RepID=UPI003DA5325E